MKAYVNGQFVPLDRATLSVHDAGVQHAVGLFETMQAFNGKVFRLDAHIARLIDSAAETGLSASLKAEPLSELVNATLAENDLTEARLRLTVTGGDLSLLGAARGDGTPAPHEPSVFCVATEPTRYPAELFERGVTVTIANAKANPFDPGAGHKTLNYWARLRTLAEASQLGAGETLWLSVTNHLCGGAVSNAFVVKADTLLTPIARGEEGTGTLPSAVLPGITRAAVIEIAEQLDIPVQRCMIGVDDLLDADEVFLTNSSWQLLPVAAVERKTIGAGRVGPITSRLREKLLDLIATETS